MICAGVQIPANYLITHMAGGSTRASAIVATEPVAKKMENRRKIITRIIKDCWDRVMKSAGLGIIPCNVIFPEIITQDRSQKLKDLQLCETNEWISPERAATLAAKEIGIDDYDYNAEMQQYKKQLPEIPPILTGQGKAPGQSGSSGGFGAGGSSLPPSPAAIATDSESALTGNERKDIKLHGTQL